MTEQKLTFILLPHSFFSQLYLLFDERSFEAILHGIKTWVALPDEYEETDPWFGHHPATGFGIIRQLNCHLVQDGTAQN